MASTYGVDVYGVGSYTVDVTTVLWPGTGVFPSTAAEPSQGNVPFIRCLISTDDYLGVTRTWRDYSDRLRSWSVTRGRPNELQRFDAGTAEAVLTNRDRALDPTVHSEFGPMNKVWLYAEFEGQTQDLFVGYTERIASTWPDGGWSDALASFQCADEFKAMSRLAPLPLVAPAEYTGARVDRLLDRSSSQAPRDVDAGSVIMETRTGTFDATSEIDLSVTTESAAATIWGVAFFFDRHGHAVFYEYGTTPAQPVAGYFTDDGFFYSYLNLDVDYSDSFLYNTATVEDTSGASGSYEEIDSIVRYGERQAPTATVSMYNVGTVSLSQMAMDLLAFYKTPLLRATRMVPDLSKADTLKASFKLDLLSRLFVSRHTPGGGDVGWAQDVTVQNLSWRGEPGTLPSLTVGLSPLLSPF